MNNIAHTIARIARHLWLDASDSRRSVPPDMLDRLTRRVRASEARHTGQIRVCVEASLPWSYVSRLSATTTMEQLSRQRAVMLFSKLQVWDTEHNNGVLIYLLLAERTIEIVADRQLDRCVALPAWAAMTQRMATAFRQSRFEDGLTQALEEVSALLVRHFPAVAGQPGSNELSDEPVIV